MDTDIEKATTLTRVTEAECVRHLQERQVDGEHEVDALMSLPFPDTKANFLSIFGHLAAKAFFQSSSQTCRYSLISPAVCFCFKSLTLFLYLDTEASFGKGKNSPLPSHTSGVATQDLHSNGPAGMIRPIAYFLHPRPQLR